jgi:predicted metal-dependent peptidase
MTPELQKIIAAKILAAEILPLSKRVIYSLENVESPECETLGVDQFGRLYYAPDYVNRTPLIALAGAICHESEHLLCRHFQRASVYFSESHRHYQHVWNLAADCFINSMLRRESVDLPDDIILPERFDLPSCKSTDFYFVELSKLFPPKPEQPQSESQGDSPGQSGQQPEGQQPGNSPPGVPGESGKPDDGRGGQNGDQQPEDVSEPPGGLEGGSSPEPSDLPDCSGGSCADGITRAYELDPPPDGGQSIEVTIRETQNFAQGTGQGSMLISVQENERIESFLSVVRKALRRCSQLVYGQDRRTYSRRSSRQQPGESLIRPGTASDSPRITMILDSSGSMGNDDRAKTLAAVDDVLKYFPGYPVRWILGGYRVEEEGTCTSSREIRVKYHGGGGTNMARMIETADIETKPELIVCVTDGETNWPTERTKASLVICLTQPVSSCEQEIPSWAHAARI